MENINKWIQIWYSWGYQEMQVEVPDGVDAWEHMKKLVANEVFVAQEEEHFGCTVYVKADEDKVELQYHADGEWCHYLITDEKDYEPCE